MSSVMETRTGYEQLTIRYIDCKAKLPASVWRSLSLAEQPGPWGEEVAVVRVDDTNTLAAVLPWRHYSALERRIRELEGWIGELMEEEAG